MFLDPVDQLGDKLEFCPYLGGSCCSKNSDDILKGIFGMIVKPRLER